jgi:hypothetical protein
MKRISALLAVIVAAMALASGIVMATTTQQSPDQARFRVTLTGFTVNKETWDHALQVDGKRDEVFIRYDTRLVNSGGTTLSESSRSTKVMGDVNGYPERVNAGSANDDPNRPGLDGSGGLRTGDSFPTDSPWEIESNLMADRPPVKLFEGNLIDGETGVAITPTVWEWDGGEDLFNKWGRSVVENGPKIAQAVANVVTGSSNKPTIQSNLELGLPALFTFVTDITGQAMDRPIGYAPANGGYDLSNARSMVLTYESALNAIQSEPIGLGSGVFSIEHKDPASIGGGTYTLYLKVERVDTPPDVTAPRPAPGKQVKDRTPRISATVTDPQTNLLQGDIDLYVDGQARSFSYDAATDRLAFQSGRLAYGAHEVTVEATDAAGLEVTKSWSFKVVRR